MLRYTQEVTAERAPAAFPEEGVKAPLSRPILAGLVIATAAAGIALRAEIAGPVAKYGGVALWATLVYLLVLLVRPSFSPRRAGALALATSFGVELLQLTPLPAFLSSQHLLLRLIFGSTFHLPDLPAYAAGVALGVGAHTLVEHRRRSAPGFRGRSTSDGRSSRGAGSRPTEF